MAKMKIGIIGCGTIANNAHIPAYLNNPDVEIKYFCDIIPEKAQAAVEKYKCGIAVTDYHEIIADPEIEVVHNCTPHYLHKSDNERIIGAGKHVLCEKPLTTNSEDAVALLEKLKQNKSLVHCVNFNYRMYPIVQQMREQCQSGSIGRVLAVHGNYVSASNIRCAGNIAVDAAYTPGEVRAKLTGDLSGYVVDVLIPQGVEPRSARLFVDGVRRGFVLDEGKRTVTLMFAEGEADPEIVLR
jgi:predicted dehydrogenase